MSDVPHNDDTALRELERTWGRPPGLWGWLTAVNNQPIGLRFMVTALIFFAIAGVMGILMRIQLAVSDHEWMGPDLFNAIFTMHGSTMMYLFAVPFLEGLALYLLPLLIGSRDVAFPRLTAFSYWMYLFGGLIMYASFLFGEVPDAGWFAYPPLSGPEYSGMGLDFWLLGLGLVEVAAITAGVEIVVTILKMRAPGMALHRMPLLVWAFLVVGVMILFAVTPLFIATVLLEMDRAMGTHFFNPDAGGSSLLWQHVFWFFGHPDVYIIFLPATGVVSAVVPVFAGRPMVGYTMVVLAIILTGFVSFGLWVHHMFATGLPQLSLVFFAGASFLIAIASGVQVFAWIATLWGSRPRFQTPLLYILGFFFVFVIGGITGVMVATIPFDLQVHDTYFIVAHFHYVLIGGAVFPIFAGLYYWFPKVTGKLPNELVGKVSFLLVFVGFNVTFFPMHQMGMFGMPRRVYTYPAELGLDVENMIATVGSFVLGIGFAMALGSLVYTAWRGRAAGPDPWQSGTLEWSVTSPPQVYSFRQPPVVSHRDPLWQTRATDRDADELHRVATAMRDAPSKWRGTLVTDALAARPQVLQPLPGPTIVPLVTAIAATLIAVGVLAETYSLSLVATGFTVVMLIHWLQPGRAELPDEAELVERLGLRVGGTGTRSLEWWGMVCLVAIGATALGTLVVSYAYLWLYSQQWPQDGLPRPSLLWPGLAHGALLLSLPLQVWISWGLRRRRPAGVGYGTGGVLALGLAFLVLQIVALFETAYGPRENAYTSAFFLLNWLTLVIAGVGVAIVGTLVLRLFWWTKDNADSRRMHMEVAELAWYFVLASAAVTFVTTYVLPHVL